LQNANGPEGTAKQFSAARTSVAAPALAREFRYANKRHVDYMLGKEPHLKFIRPNDTAHEQIVCSIVASFGRQASHCPGLF